MEKLKNPYEHLKVSDTGTDRQSHPVSRMTVSSHPAESVYILTVCIDGAWIYGYQVYWANGHTSQRTPSTSSGTFRTEQDARLYCIGFLRSYASYFRPDTLANIRAAESRLLKPVLPL